MRPTALSQAPARIGSWLHDRMHALMRDRMYDPMHDPMRDPMHRPYRQRRSAILPFPQAPARIGPWLPVPLRGARSQQRLFLYNQALCVYKRSFINYITIP